MFTHLAHLLLHSCGLQRFEPPDQPPQVWNQGRIPVQCSVPPLYRAVGVLLLSNNAANHTQKLGVEPVLDPPVTARVKVASVEGLDVVDQLVGSVADAFLIACEECVDACVGKQFDVVLMNNFSQSQRSENF